MEVNPGLNAWQSGPTANRPPKPQVGQNYFDTTINKPIWWNGSAWVLAAAGGSVTGDPTTVAFFDPITGVLSDSPQLTAAKLDAYQRPQIHDYRVGPSGRGAVSRLGQWGIDGDPSSVTSEGFVTYGANALGNGPDGTAGGFGFYEPNGFGELNIIPGVNGGNSFYLCGFEDGSINAPFGLDGFIVNDNANAPIFWVKRSDNSITARTLRVGFAPASSSEWRAGSGDPNTFITGNPGDFYTNAAGGTETSLYVKGAGVGTNTGWNSVVTQEYLTGFVLLGSNIPLHGSNSGVQLSSIVSNRAQYRGNQYGANAGAPGISTFKSRGATVGSLSGVLPLDPLFRATCVGVAPDNASIPLAGFITIQVPGNFVPAGQAFVPSEYELQLVPLAGPINSRRIVFKVSSEGETQTLRGVRAGGTATLPSNLTTGSLWSSGNGSPEGVITGNPGDLYTNTAGGAGTTLFVKESGVGNTGWIGK